MSYMSDLEKNYNVYTFSDEKERPRKSTAIRRARSGDPNSYLFAWRVCLLCSPVIVGYLLEPRNPRGVQEASRQTSLQKGEVSNRGNFRVECHVRLLSWKVCSGARGRRY